MPQTSLNTLLKGIKTGAIKSWDEVHEFYNKNSQLYQEQKLQHSFASLIEVLNITPNDLTKQLFNQLLKQTLDTKEWMVKEIYESRAKDYRSEFRKMVYETKKEMDKVLGSFADNSFILQQKKELLLFKKTISGLLKQFR
jgi:hypothetical protein